jgi:hypothetical protein
MFHTSSDSQGLLVINTLLQRGVVGEPETQNRFNGFFAGSKTAEAVRPAPPHFYTPLKQGVNEKRQNNNHLVSFDVQVSTS